VPRLRRQERTRDERSTVELDKLRADLRPQSKQERERRLEADVSAERDGEAGKAPIARSPSTGARLPQREPLRERIQRAREVEERVLERIRAVASSHYELAANVKVEGPTPLLLDGVLTRINDPRPDVVVEVKYAPHSVEMNLSNRVSEALTQLIRYRARVARRAVIWLVVVTDGRPTLSMQGALDRVTADVRSDLVASMVADDEIEKLVLPPQLLW
jgi:hypothetical protein